MCSHNLGNMPLNFYLFFSILCVGLLRKLILQVMEKENYIMECEERLRAMEALKEENLTLHKSLKSTHDKADQPDPRDISTALEEEWMRRLTETREMYERAVLGYRDQLHEMQDKLQRAEANHASHVEELIVTIEELKRQEGSESRGNGELQEDDGSKGGGTKSSERLSARRTEDKDDDRSERTPSDRGTVGDAFTGDDDGRAVERSPSAGDERARIRTYDVEDDKNAAGVFPSEKTEEARGEKRSPKGTRSESNKDSAVPEEGRRRPPNIRDQGIAPENRQIDINRVKTCDKRTQTSPVNIQNNEELGMRSEITQYHTDVGRVDGDMGELKENLERISHMVQRLENMKLSGEGATAILSTIRDTISECLHEWRESFRQHRSQHKDSADENKGYVELQRKLRSKTKQLEAKQKQCKVLEEQNATLVKQCKRLEAQVSDIVNMC